LGGVLKYAVKEVHRFSEWFYWYFRF